MNFTFFLSQLLGAQKSEGYILGGTQTSQREEPRKQKPRSRCAQGLDRSSAQENGAEKGNVAGTAESANEGPRVNSERARSVREVAILLEARDRMKCPDRGARAFRPRFVRGDVREGRVVDMPTSRRRTSQRERGLQRSSCSGSVANDLGAEARRSCLSHEDFGHQTAPSLSIESRRARLSSWRSRGCHYSLRTLKSVDPKRFIRSGDKKANEAAEPFRSASQSAIDSNFRLAFRTRVRSLYCQ